jgi:hypothetical protein
VYARVLLHIKIPSKKSEAAGATRNVYESLVFHATGWIWLCNASIVDCCVYIYWWHHSVKSRQKLEAFSNMVHPHAEAAFWTWLGGWGGCGFPSKTLQIANLPGHESATGWSLVDKRRSRALSLCSRGSRLLGSVSRESVSAFWGSSTALSQKPSFFLFLFLNKFILINILLLLLLLLLLLNFILKLQ